MDALAAEPEDDAAFASARAFLCSLSPELSTPLPSGAGGLGRLGATKRLRGGGEGPSFPRGTGGAADGGAAAAAPGAATATNAAAIAAASGDGGSANSGSAAAGGGPRNGGFAPAATASHFPARRSDPLSASRPSGTRDGAAERGDFFARAEFALLDDPAVSVAAQRAARAHDAFTKCINRLHALLASGTGSEIGGRAEGGGWGRLSGVAGRDGGGVDTGDPLKSLLRERVRVSKLVLISLQLDLIAVALRAAAVREFGCGLFAPEGGVADGAAEEAEEDWAAAVGGGAWGAAGPVVSPRGVVGGTGGSATAAGGSASVCDGSAAAAPGAAAADDPFSTALPLSPLSPEKPPPGDAGGGGAGGGGLPSPLSDSELLAALAPLSLLDRLRCCFVHSGRFRRLVALKFWAEWRLRRDEAWQLRFGGPGGRSAGGGGFSGGRRPERDVRGFLPVAAAAGPAKPALAAAGAVNARGGNARGGNVRGGNVRGGTAAPAAGAASDAPAASGAGGAPAAPFHLDAAFTAPGTPDIVNPAVFERVFRELSRGRWRALRRFLRSAEQPWLDLILVRGLEVGNDPPESPATAAYEAALAAVRGEAALADLAGLPPGCADDDVDGVADVLFGMGEEGFAGHADAGGGGGGGSGGGSIGGGGALSAAFGGAFASGGPAFGGPASGSLFGEPSWLSRALFSFSAICVPAVAAFALDDELEVLPRPAAAGETFFCGNSSRPALVRTARRALAAFAAGAAAGPRTMSVAERAVFGVVAGDARAMLPVCAGAGERLWAAVVAATEGVIAALAGSDADGGAGGGGAGDGAAAGGVAAGRFGSGAAAAGSVAAGVAARFDPLFRGDAAAPSVSNAAPGSLLRGLDFSSLSFCPPPAPPPAPRLVAQLDRFDEVLSELRGACSRRTGSRDPGEQILQAVLEEFCGERAGSQGAHHAEVASGAGAAPPPCLMHALLASLADRAVQIAATQPGSAGGDERLLRAAAAEMAADWG